MSPDHLILIELTLVFGGVLGLALWQVISVRRSMRRDREVEAARQAAARDQAASE